MTLISAKLLSLLLLPFKPHLQAVFGSSEITDFTGQQPHKYVTTEAGMVPNTVSKEGRQVCLRYRLYGGAYNYHSQGLDSRVQ